MPYQLVLTVSFAMIDVTYGFLPSARIWLPVRFALTPAIELNWSRTWLP